MTGIPRKLHLEKNIVMSKSGWNSISISISIFDRDVMTAMEGWKGKESKGLAYCTYCMTQSVHVFQGVSYTCLLVCSFLFHVDIESVHSFD
jgi:hypothetical protein